MKKIIILTLIITYLSFESSGAAIGEIGGPFKCGELECPNGSVCEIVQTPIEDYKSVRITTQCKSVEGTILQEVTTTKEVPAGQIPVTSIKKKLISGSIVHRGFCGGASEDNNNVRGANEDGTYQIDGAENKDEAAVDSEFVPLDSETDMDIDIDHSDHIDTGYDKIWSIFDQPRNIFKETTSFINRLFSNLFC